jgi:cytochrome c biogenesis factor
VWFGVFFAFMGLVDEVLRIVWFRFATCLLCIMTLFLYVSSSLVQCVELWRMFGAFYVERSDLYTLFVLLYLVLNCSYHVWAVYDVYELRFVSRHVIF